MRECPSCGRPNADSSRYCATCGYSFTSHGPIAVAGETGPARPEERGRDAAAAVAAPLPEWFRKRHPRLLVLALLVWGLTLLSIPALLFTVSRLLHSDNAALGWTTLGLVAYNLVAPSFVVVATLAATNALPSKGAQIAAGAALWFLVVPILVIWLAALVAGGAGSSGRAREFRRWMNRVAGGAALGVLVVIGGLGTFMLGAALTWIGVMIWAPIRLVRAARDHSLGPAAPGAMPAPA